MNSYERFCYSLLGNRVKNKREKYYKLIDGLKASRMNTPFEAYYSTAFCTSALVGLIAALLIALVTWALNLPKWITYRGNVPGDMASQLNAMSGYKLAAGSIIAFLVAFVLIFGITYAIYLSYPSVVAGTRKRNIDATLPYAINYLAAMSTAGITPAEVFRQLGNSSIYGEASVEARYVSLEVDVFGKDLIEALKSVSLTTPSTRMRDFLQGSIASIASGSNISEYFKSKSEQFSYENRQSQKQFLETLALIAESYVTAVVAGSLFLILLQSIMSILSGEGTPIFLYIVIYLIIPFASIMFVILIDAMTPEI